jgi:phage-related baseplate assembly protein
VVTAISTYYESITGKKLQPAQVERLVFNAAGYRIGLLLNQINETANQCLVAFAIGSALEALAELVGVTRLPASPAQCVIRFSLVDGHGALVIDTGLRIQSIDGQAVFSTIESKSVLTGDTYADIKCECTKTGIIGNGYAVNTINVILDPRPYVSSAANADITNGGNDDETDDLLRERVRLAPSAFSVAGPKGAYKFWAKSAHPTIVDVAVTIGHDVSTGAIIPGQVDIFPLLLNNATPSAEITDAIYAICNDDKIRPLSDTVLVKSPTKLDYAITVNLTILTDADSTAVAAAVTLKLQAYRDKRKNKLAIDVVINQIIKECQEVDGMYNTVVVSPTTSIVAGESSFTNCTGITVTVTGTHDE